ncbi:SusC/RagA family TonB-linked outer membrane protein [Chitinophaga sp. MM2321]|uniref:SusC/RagA family TonB-linked outer membrane protein n=1 Tax=Chitinophaga sp. MM2321 TaxID=3137178 RepID=UPI0032D5AFF5
MVSMFLQRNKGRTLLLSCLLFLLSVNIAVAQSISGTVRSSADNQPLPGVTVIISGTLRNAQTDGKGHFQLSPVYSADSLVFTYIGYSRMAVVVGAKKEMNITMEPTASSLDQVVVVGYGTQKKSDLTGAVVRVMMDDKSLLANTNVFQALSGSAAGVNIEGAGGAGGEPGISIRGRTSLSASDRPLIVLDGIIYNGSISDINVSDVESVDILKDASAAAVYGSRSANGVMLITTKKGKTDKPVVSFSTYYGFQDMTNNPMKVMDADQYALRLVDYFYQQELYNWYKTNPTSDAGKPVYPNVNDRSVVAGRLRTQEERDNYMAGNKIDWVKEVLRPAPIQNYNLSLSGKNGRTSYYVSGSYTDEAGIQKNDNYKRLTLRTNIESKVADWLTLGLISSYSYRDHSGLPASLADARAASPLADNKIGSANYDMFLTGEGYMPYPLNNLYVDNKNISNDLFMVGSAKISVPWVEGLTYELNYSNTYANSKNNTFYPVTTPLGSINKGQAIKNPAEARSWIVNNIVSYRKTFKDHQVNATLLYSRENSRGDTSTLNAQGFDNPFLGYNNMALGSVATVASSAGESNGISYMARASYSFKNRYLLTATIRRDGFSGFGAANKFATFPSLSLGWVASEESFLHDKGVYLKLRASYGKNGNQGIGSYSSLSRMATDAYVFGSTSSVAIYPSTLGNADLGWEETASYNFGVDFGFLQQRITGSVDVYKARTNNVLVSRGLPPAAGYPSVWTNIGAIDNKGIELTLSTVNVEGPFSWRSDFMFSLNRDKISKLYGGANDKDLGNSWFVGEPISAIYDYKMAGGVWTENDLYSGNILKKWYPGQFKYVDQNKDGVIDANNDRDIIGYKTPNYRFSIKNTFSYKNFTFSFFLNSVQGGNGYYLANNASAINASSAPDGYESASIIRTNVTAVRPYWTPDNGVTNAAGIYYAPAVWSGVYQSRSFIRLQDVSLGYQFGSQLLKTLKIQALQVYIASKNAYTWTKWSGWDPETGSGDTPLMRNITAGARLTF